MSIRYYSLTDRQSREHLVRDLSDKWQILETYFDASNWAGVANHNYDPVWINIQAAELAHNKFTSTLDMRTINSAIRVFYDHDDIVRRAASDEAARLRQQMFPVLDQIGPTCGCRFVVQPLSIMELDEAAAKKLEDKLRNQLLHRFVGPTRR